MLVVSHLVAEIRCDSTQSEEHQDIAMLLQDLKCPLIEFTLVYIYTCFQTAISEYTTMMDYFSLLSPFFS